MAVISRRGFLGLLGSVAAGTFVEPEHLVKVFDMAVQQPVRFYGGYGTGSMFNIWYADRMSRQIEKSVQDAAGAASEFKFRHYVVVTPEYISPAQKKWLLGLGPRRGFRSTTGATRRSPRFSVSSSQGWVRLPFLFSSPFFPP